VARLKLGDYYYYGYGTDVDYQQAATHYKYATEISHNAQAMYNLAYMHENGLGLKRDIHLAKRFYDLASDTASEAYIPVTLALFKLNCLFYTEFLKNNYNKLFSLFSLFELYWDVYLMGLIGVLLLGYVIRQRLNTN
jgi:SEL1 protein